MELFVLDAQSGGKKPAAADSKEKPNSAMGKGKVLPEKLNRKGFKEERRLPRSQESRNVC